MRHIPERHVTLDSLSRRGSPPGDCALPARRARVIWARRPRGERGVHAGAALKEREARETRGVTRLRLRTPSKPSALALTCAHEAA